ncbi:MAG: MBL fold metallo-hydrolase [Cyanophyceae cyanobacterium]
MKRRQLIRYGAMGMLAGAGAVLGGRDRAIAADQLSIEYHGHTCFRLVSSGLTVLNNPFKPAGCTENFAAPRLNADVVTISSHLLDEGYIQELPGNPGLLRRPGLYRFKGVQFQGLGMAHDRVGGFRFGRNIAWLWEQAGMNIFHMGGAAGELDSELRILIGQPDVLILPVGGGEKAYDAREAIAVINELNPRLVIPSHYRTEAANSEACDIDPVSVFIKALGSDRVKTISNSRITITNQSLPESGPPLVRVLSPAIVTA